MGFLNVVSVPLHIDEIRLLLRDEHFDLLALNETRLDRYYSDDHDDVRVNGYKIRRDDRNRRGGGVCIYIKESINFY